MANTTIEFTMNTVRNNMGEDVPVLYACKTTKESNDDGLFYIVDQCKTEIPLDSPVNIITFYRMLRLGE